MTADGAGDPSGRSPSPRTAPDLPPRSALRTAAAAAVALEALALVAVAVFLVVELVVADPGSALGAAFLALLALLAGIGLAAVAVGMARGRRWSRAPAATWQLLQVSLALPALGPLPALAVALLVPVAIVLWAVVRAPFERAAAG